MTDAESEITDRVTVSYPEDGVVGSELTSDHYRGYLRRARAGPVAAGDEWTESVSYGCGVLNEITLRVETVSGGSTVGAGTDLKFVARLTDE